MQDKKYKLWLSGLPKIGPMKYMNLMEHFGSAEAIFKSSKKEIIESNILNQDLIDMIISMRDLGKLDRYYKKMKENNIKVYTIDEKEYPENLKTIYDPPPVLYVKGDIIESDKNAFAIVGSRKASEYGLRTAEQYGQEMAEEGFTIISGMALGIDSAAHRGALKAKGRTIAVFGCGLSHVYPKSGFNLSKEIIKNGAIVSEYPLGFPALPQNFPARNRIISGMSRGLLVVEANKKSGSLITTNFALEQGREVFAIPGNINSPNSKGTNELIKDGAKLVNSISDILEEFYDYVKDKKSSNKNQNMDDIEKEIIDLLNISGRSMDEIIESLTIEASIIIRKVSLLEIRGLVKQIEGIFYID